VFAQSFGTVGCFTQMYCAFLLVMRCGLLGGIPSHEAVGPVCDASNFFSWDCQQLLLALYLTGTILNQSHFTCIRYMYLLGSFVLGQTPILMLIVIFFKPEEEATFISERRFMRVSAVSTTIFIIILILVAAGLFFVLFSCSLSLSLSLSFHNNNPIRIDYFRSNVRLPPCAGYSGHPSWRSLHGEHLHPTNSHHLPIETKGGTLTHHAWRTGLFQLACVVC